MYEDPMFSPQEFHEYIIDKYNTLFSNDLAILLKYANT